jgi:hypothetical protein
MYSYIVANVSCIKTKHTSVKHQSALPVSIDGLQIQSHCLFQSSQDVEDILLQGGGLEILVRLFNKVKEGKDFPTDWKIAIVCPIFKVKVGQYLR